MTRAMGKVIHPVFGLPGGISKPLTEEDRQKFIAEAEHAVKFGLFSLRLFNDLVRWERLFLIRGKVEEAWGVYTVTIEKLAGLRRVMEKGIEETSRARREKRDRRARVAAGSSTGKGRSRV